MILTLNPNKIYEYLERWKLYRVQRIRRKGFKILISVVLGALLLNLCAERLKPNEF